MRTPLFVFKVAILATATCLDLARLAPPAEAQTAPPSGMPPPASSAAPNARADLAAAIEVLAQRYQVQIVVDPQLEAPGVLRKPDRSASFAAAFQTLTRQIKNAAWIRLSLKRDAGMPSPEKLAATVRALNRLSQTELLVENPPKERGALLLSLPRSRMPEAQAEIDLLDAKPIYLLYNTALPADGKTALERIAESQRRQLQLIAQLPPEQRPNPARLGLQVLQNLVGTGHEAALNAVGEAGMAAWQNTAPAARDAMMQQFIKTAQNSPPLDSDPAANPEVGAPAPPTHLDTLRDIAAILAKRYDVRILVDPALNVPAPPTRPSPEMTLAQALDLLLHSVPDAAWRRVYQRPPTSSSFPLSARSLAATVRLLDNVPPVLLHCEDTASRRSMTLQTDLPATDLSAKLAAHAFAAPPATYLLYSTQDAMDLSLPAVQRLEQIQRSQMEQLLGLNSSQMNQVMTETLTQYADGTGDTSAEMMRLPIMALLMGTWFPQKAKEH